ncbi:MAG: putative toxin-antitoxin system toxin component, PIN family [Arenimonas sp.]|nr:putative toxin-antitoxin system toxin component, PIN family [Arenimonas sp.]
MSSAPAVRWVLDTNVVLSALVRPGGLAGRLRLAWQAGLFVPVVCQATAVELMRVLAYPKFKLTPDERHTLLADYLPWAEVFVLPKRLPAVPACRDPGEVVFLQLAYASQAEALVSGDQDLLSVAGSRLPLLTLAAAIKQLGPQAHR